MRIRGRLNELDESAVTADAVQLTSSGAYYTDNVIEATVSFSEAVDVTGTPTLALQIGENSRPAVYDSGGGSSELVFSYTVVEGDRDANGVSVLLNALAAPAGASIAKQGSNTNAVLNVLPGLLDEQVHKVNTGPAILLRRGIQFTSRPATAGGDTYGLGETIEITVTFDEPAIVDTAGGVPTFKIQMGHDDTGESRTAVYARGSGSAELVFGYDVQSGDRDINGVSALSNSLELNSGTIRNAAGFDALLSIGKYRAVVITRWMAGSNQRPTADDSSVTTEEDTPYTFQADDFNFSDDDTGDMFDSVTLVTLPADGALTLDIAAVIAGAVVPVTQIGMLVYTPEENEYGTDEFNFRVSDGNHESADDYTMTVTVTRVDDPATGAPTISGTAQVGETLTADTSTIEDVDVIGGTPTSFSYRWIRVDDGTEAPIAGATGKNYFLALADAGKKIKVEVSYKQDLLGDPTATLTSEAFPETGTIDGSGVEEVTAVCDRTGAVRDAIVAAVPRVNDCANVTSAQLVAITGQLNLVGAGITELAEGDFSGLRALNSLLLNNNNLSTLPAGLFDGLTALQYLYLNSNAEMRTLPAGIFDSLSALEYLHLHNNRLNQLPAGLFDELVSLKTLDLSGNRLRQTGTNALPDGIFELLTALTTLDMSGQGQGRRFNPVADAVALDGKVSSAGGTVRLDGSGSGGPWGTNVTYEWALTNPANGLMVEFDDHTGDSPQVTIPAWHAGSVLTFTLTVSVSAAAGGIDPDTATATVTVNTAPQASDWSITIDEDAAHTFSSAQFNFDDDDGDTLASVTVVTLPEAGELTRSGAAVMAGEVVPNADIGNLVFTPAANANGAPYASFTFKVSDGTQQSTSSNTVTVNVTAVNDPATGAPTISGTAQVGETLTADKGTVTDDDGTTQADAGDVGYAYTYEWIRVDGTTETPIAGETAEIYILTAADEGKKIKVQVSFTDDAGNSASLTSEATAPVAAQTEAAVTVTIEAEYDPIGGGLEDLVFTLTRQGTTADELAATVTIAQDEAWLDAPNLTHTVTFAAGEATASLNFAASEVSLAPETSGDLTATVSGTGIAGGEVTVEIVSTAQPPITIRYDMSSYTFKEDADDEAIYAVATLHTDYPRPPGNFQVSFSSRAGTAVSGSMDEEDEDELGNVFPFDYNAISWEDPFRSSDFVRDADTDPFMARKLVERLVIENDDIYEGSEQFTMIIERSAGLRIGLVQVVHPNGTTCEINVCASTPAYTVTITDEEDRPELSLSAAPASIARQDDSGTTGIEENVSTLTAWITNGKTFATDRTVTLDFGGTAVEGTDYSVSPTVVKPPPARRSGSVAGVTGACVCDGWGLNWLRVG